MRPAYEGSVWFDASTSEVLRIEMETRQMPEEFPLDKVESTADYEYVRRCGPPGLAPRERLILPDFPALIACMAI